MNRRRRQRNPRTVQDFVRAGILRPVQPTASSGWTRYGTGREFMPAATNYATNPGMNTDTDSDGFADNVTSALGSITMTGTLTDSGLGYYIQRVSVTCGAGVASSNGIYIGTVTTAIGTFASTDSATASVYARRVSASGMNASLTVASCNEAGSVLAATFTEFTSTDFARVTATRAFSGEATTSRARAYITLSNCSEGDTIVIEFYRSMLEKSGTASTYFDGSMADCAWTGTANASTSTRTVSALTVPVALSNTAWTVAGRYTAPWAHNDSLAHNLLTLYAGADARATVYKHTDQKLYASVTDGTDTVTSASAAQTLAANTVNTFVASSTWAGTVDLMLNGTASTQGDASAVAAQTITALTIGGTPNGYMGPLVVSPEDKASAWKVAISGSSGAAFSDTTRLVRDFMDVGDYILPLTGDATAYEKVGGGDCPFDLLGRLIVDGDSLSGSNLTIKWPYQYVTGRAWDYLNVAVSGQSAAQMLADAETEVDVLYDSSVTNVVTCWAGANDLYNAYDDLALYAAGRQAVGFKVVVFTVLPQTERDATWEAARQTFNTNMRANYTDFADALVDVAADERIGDEDDDEDATYYSDGTHLTEAGYAIVAGLVETAIDGIL